MTRARRSNGAHPDAPILQKLESVQEFRRSGAGRGITQKVMLLTVFLPSLGRGSSDPAEPT